MGDPRTALLQVARGALERPMKTLPTDVRSAWRQLVVKYRDKRVAPVLLQAANSDKAAIAREARGWYAVLGLASTGAEVATWLREHDAATIKEVARGVQMAVDLGHTDKAFVRPVADALAHVVRVRAPGWFATRGAKSETNIYTVYQAVEALAALDPYNAWPVLWSEEVFQIAHPALRPVVMVWSDTDGYSAYIPKDVPPPPVDRVWAVYHKLDAGARVVQQQLRRATQAEALCALAALDPEGVAQELARLKSLGLAKDDFVMEEVRRLSRRPEPAPDLASLARRFAKDNSLVRGNAADMMRLWNMVDAVAARGLTLFVKKNEDAIQSVQFALIELGCGVFAMLLGDLHEELEEDANLAKHPVFKQRVRRFERRMLTMGVRERIERYASTKPKLFRTRDARAGARG
jgi:hypothetical protein